MWTPEWFTSDDWTLIHCYTLSTWTTSPSQRALRGFAAAATHCFLLCVFHCSSWTGGCFTCSWVRLSGCGKNKSFSMKEVIFFHLGWACKPVSEKWWSYITHFVFFQFQRRYNCCMDQWMVSILSDGAGQRDGLTSFVRVSVLVIKADAAAVILFFLFFFTCSRFC